MGFNNGFDQNLFPNNTNAFGFGTNARPMLAGRMINNISDLKPQDVPNDGNPVYFPTMDGSTIFARFWDKNSNLRIVRYTLDTEPIEEVQKQKSPVELIMERLDSIEAQLASSKSTDQPKVYNGSNQQKNNRKGGENA